MAKVNIGFGEEERPSAKIYLHNITVFLKGITDAYKLSIDFLSPFTN